MTSERPSRSAHTLTSHNIGGFFKCPRLTLLCPVCLLAVLQVPMFFMVAQAPGLYPALADSARAASAFVFIAVNRGASLALGC
jgi:hypothetical protein